MNDQAFLKRFGFNRPPRAYFEGTWVAFKDRVEAVLSCKCCGNQLNITFRGNPDTMTEAGIGDWVLRRAEKHHQCPAVMDLLAAKTHKFYNDIRRGSEKMREQDHRNRITGHS